MPLQLYRPAPHSLTMTIWRWTCMQKKASMEVFH
jgi:hypothetical protein